MNEILLYYITKCVYAKDVLAHLLLRVGPSGAPLHTLSKLYYVPVSFVTPPPYFEAEYCLFCGRRRVAVARYRMICLVLVNSHLFPLPCGAGSAVPREGFDLSVIILASLLVFPMLGCRHSLLRF